MKLYFAGLCDPTLVTSKTNVLLSYLDKTSIEKLSKPIFLDSGAFSVFTQGKTINIDEYIAYITESPAKFETYAVLDVIGSWEKTRENLEYMESKRLHPLPTFHFNSPEKELRRLIKNYDYIALGGLVPLSKDRTRLKRWLDYCFSILGTKTKIHGFGITGAYLDRYPFYSVDSTSWLSYAAYRKTVIHRAGRMVVYNKDSELRPTSKNISSHVLSGPEISRNIINEYLKLEKYITRLWEKRGIVWED